MTGHGLHHSDIGGYTTLFEMKRSKELLLRWCDFSAFTPMMRTHEGNRPGDNWQFDGDADTIAHFARMTTVFTTLKPYIKAAVAQNAKSGLPVMRPLFLHYEDDARAYTLKYQYLFGRDLLVAPVHEEDAATGRSICRRTPGSMRGPGKPARAVTSPLMPRSANRRSSIASKANGQICLAPTSYLIWLARRETCGQTENNNESTYLIRQPCACRLKKNSPTGWAISALTSCLISARCIC